MMVSTVCLLLLTWPPDWAVTSRLTMYLQESSTAGGGLQAVQ